VRRQIAALPVLELDEVRRYRLPAQRSAPRTKARVGRFGFGRFAFVIVLVRGG
jgi:hypothetical protein